MATRLGLGDLDVTDRSPGLRLEGTLKRGFGDFEQLKKAWHSDVFLSGEISLCFVECHSDPFW